MYVCIRACVCVCHMHTAKSSPYSSTYQFHSYPTMSMTVLTTARHIFLLTANLTKFQVLQSLSLQLA